MQAQEWAHSYRYSLKKDELARVDITSTNSGKSVKYELFFRWTLVVKDRVTLLLNYKGHPYQYVLYKKRSLDTIRVELLNDGQNKLKDKTFLILVLDKIDKKEGEVSFNLFIKDKNSRILVDFKKADK